MIIDEICIVGLGYVGLPLAVAFAEKRSVIGFDISKNRIKELNKSCDSTLEVESELLLKVKRNITYTLDIQDARNCRIFIITVPTPIDSANRPDLAPLIMASQTVGAVLKKGDIVIYESTVYPGVTEEICAPVLEKVSKMKFNQDFYCGYSPERINPGDKDRTIKKILKVTSGSTPETAQIVDELYKTVIDAGTHLAPSIKVAEASKVIENTQRDVNIALINELAIIFNQMGIDTSEVLAAAGTKWNFIKLAPGLVGGHCIGVDPYYLTFKAEELGYKPNLILAARQINNGMSRYIVDQTLKNMIKAGKLIKDSNVLILGATFKENCPDMRNSKVLDIIEDLQDFDLNVDVYDPWVASPNKKDHKQITFICDPFGADKKYDAIIVAVAHNQFKAYTEEDYKFLSKDKIVVIDVKNIAPKPTWKL